MLRLWALPLVLMFQGLLFCVNALAVTSDTKEENIEVSVAVVLEKAYSELEAIKTQVSGASSDADYGKLRGRTQDLMVELEQLGPQLLPLSEKLQTQLDVLGAAPAAGTLETKPAAQLRQKLSSAKKKSIVRSQKYSCCVLKHQI